MKTRILIADDSRPVRHSLHGLLEQHTDWEVCADAVDGADAIAKARQLKPDLIVLDFFMPGITGVDAARTIKGFLPSVPIMIVTLEITTQLVELAKEAGVKGAVQKSDTTETVKGIEALLRRETFFHRNHCPA